MDDAGGEAEEEDTNAEASKAAATKKVAPLIASKKVIYPLNKTCPREDFWEVAAHSPVFADGQQYQQMESSSGRASKQLLCALRFITAGSCTRVET